MEKQNQNQLLQAENRIEIEGILVEKDLKIKPISRQGKQEEAITGKLDIKTGDNSIHTVEVFSYLKKNDGGENGIAKGLITIMNEYKAVAQEGVGEANADKVRVKLGDLRKNEYYGQDGQLKSYNQYSASIIERVRPDEEFNPRAKFEVEVYIQAVNPEIKNDEETGRVIIKGLVPLYGGKIVPMDFTVANEKAVKYIENNYEAGNTVKLFGEIVNTVIVEKIVEEAAFGEDNEKIKTTTTRELLVTGGLAPYDEENPRAYSSELIKKALVERDTYLDELKRKSEEKKESVNPADAGGFNVDEGDAPSSKGDSYSIPF